MAAPTAGVGGATLPWMAVDLTALVQLLRDNPEQRVALRSVLLGDGPDVGATLARLAEAQERTELRLDTLAQRVDELAQAQTRTEQRLGALTARVEGLAEHLRELAVRQRQTEESLKALVDVVSGMNDSLGKLNGESLERRYREKGQALLSQIATRLRLIDGTELGVLIDDAEQAGTLIDHQANSLLVADAVFTGLERRNRERVHLVVEASVTIGHSDVRRARERADLLARIVPTPVLAVVAGEFAPSGVAQAAHDADVWRVIVGRATRPGEDEPDR